MATVRRQVVVGCSIIYLLVLTGLAVYAMHSITTYNLPIANIISAFVIALPPLAGVALETVMSLNERLVVKGQIQTSRVFQITVAFFLVVEASIATLAGSHIAPRGALTCALSEKWHEMFSKHDASSIRKIQDAFNCCGFNQPQHMAFPFPHGDQVKADACMVEYKRNTACLGPWREQERKIAIILLVVVTGVFLWKIVIILAPSSQSAWLPSHIQLPGENEAGARSGRRRPRPALGYRDLEDVAEADEDSLRQEVNNLNEDSHLATHVEGNRRRPSNVFGEANQWQQEHGGNNAT